MAEFPQSAASRAAMHDAAQSYLNSQLLSGPAKAMAQQLGVSERQVYRYRSFITGKGSQARNPRNALQKLAKQSKPLKVKMKADYAAGGDSGYLRDGKDMPAGGSGVPVDGAAFLESALNNPDEAYQQFFDEYVLPSGTVENVQISFQ